MAIHASQPVLSAWPSVGGGSHPPSAPPALTAPDDTPRRAPFVVPQWGGPSAALDRILSLPAVGIGIFAGTVNAIAGRIHPSFAKGGELIPVRDPDAIRGAMLVRGAIDVAPRPRNRRHFTLMRASRPLLAQVNANVPRGGTARLTFAADARGNDFGVAGREVAPVSVYVDGHYHSDILAMSERGGQYTVNLSGVSPGTHTVELRFARDIAGAQAKPPKISKLTVRPVTGTQALIARYAPVVETRWSPDFERGGQPDQMHSDVPLAMINVVQPMGNGTRRLRYYLMSSNEDTSGFPFATIFRKFGRTADYELMYEVYVRSDGSKVKERFQGPLHIRWRFKGERHGDRPVLRVTTRNGMFAANTYGMMPRWSEMPAGSWGHIPEDREVMLAMPWMFAAMGKENLREGRSAPRGTLPRSNKIAYDAREHLYFEARDRARLQLERDRAITVVLKDGRRFRFPVGKEDFRPPPRGLPPRSTAVPLPPGIPSAMIAALVLPQGRVFTLDDNFAPRHIPLVQQP